MLVPSNLVKKFLSLPLSKWLKWNLMGHELKDHIRDWPERVAACCWWQWKWRNDTIFNNNTLPFVMKRSFLQRQLTEQALGWSQIQSHSQSSLYRMEIEVKWERPQISVVKLNVDGASKGNPGYAGAGCIIRDHNGQ